MLEVCLLRISIVTSLDKVFLNTCPVRTQSELPRSSTAKNCVADLFVLRWTTRDLVPTIIVEMTDAMIVHLVMIAIGTTATETTGGTAGTDPDRLLVVLITTIVAHPGLRPPGGRLMIEGLQGTIPKDAETIEDAKTKKNDSRKGLRGMAKAVGRVEWF
jgi:hypothetical protein